MNDHYCKNSILLVNPALQAQKWDGEREVEIWLRREKKRQTDSNRSWEIDWAMKFKQAKSTTFQSIKVIVYSNALDHWKSKERKKTFIYFALDLDLSLGVCLLVCLHLILANALPSNQIETWLHVSFGVQCKHQCWSAGAGPRSNKKKLDSANNIINW